MDSVNKAKFEQRMILILLVIFVACFVQMLRRLGIIGGKAQPAPTVVGAPAPAVTRAPLLTPALERHRTRTEAVETSGVGVVVRPAANASGPALTHEPSSVPRRDPLVSLLPSELPRAGTSAQATAVTTAPRSGASGAGEETAPPPLTVHGVIVGGRYPQALIDEGVYGVGDLVKGIRIIAIEREGVLVMTPGGVYRLSPDAGAVLVTREVSP